MMTWKTFINPFVKFDEKTLFFAGIFSIATVFLISYFLGFQTDSLFHFRLINTDDSIGKIVLSTVIVYAVNILIFFLFGKLINKRTRLIDIANPIFISQFTVVFILLISNIPIIEEAQNQILATVESKSAQIEPLSLFVITIYSFFSLAISIYGVAILFNGFKTATNMKKWSHILIFAILLITLMITMQLL